MGRPADAEGAWTAALAARPGDVDLLISLATAMAAQDRTSEASLVLQGALAEDPQHVRAWTQLGVIALVRHDFGTADDALRRALALDPQNAEARFHLALLHVLVGAHDEAREALQDLASGDGSFSGEAIDLLEAMDGPDPS